jgi:hypothetical protein
MNNRLPRADGEVALLNVGEGDTKLSFDPNNPAECIRAARIVKDMLKRGYALLIQLPDGTYTRCHAFREDVFAYVIADFDPITAAEHDAQEEQDGQQAEAGPAAAPGEVAQDKPRRGRKPKTVSVAASSTRAVAVAPTAGG